MRRFLLILFASFAAATMSQAALAADTIYIVRHLQKADGADPPLSDLGAANARALADRLANSGIEAIFATPTQRAMQTGQPLAQTLHITITSYDPRDPAALVKAAAGVKGSILVVGHSNTVADLVASFGGTKPEPLTEQDYGTVFVVKPGLPNVERIELSQPAR